VTIQQRRPAADHDGIGVSQLAFQGFRSFKRSRWANDAASKMLGSSRQSTWVSKVARRTRQACSKSDSRWTLDVSLSPVYVKSDSPTFLSDDDRNSFCWSSRYRKASIARVHRRYPLQSVCCVVTSVVHQSLDVFPARNDLPVDSAAISSITFSVSAGVPETSQQVR